MVASHAAAPGFTVLEAQHAPASIRVVSPAPRYAQ
jgi:hypothetical protein